MSIWIIYGLVIIFLVAFPLLVLAFVQAPEASTQTEQGSSGAAHVDKVSYGLVLAFFVLFALLTFAIHRNNSSGTPWFENQGLVKASRYLTSPSLY